MLPAFASSSWTFPAAWDWTMVATWSARPPARRTRARRCSWFKPSGLPRPADATGGADAGRAVPGRTMRRPRFRSPGSRSSPRERWPLTTPSGNSMRSGATRPRRRSRASEPNREPGPIRTRDRPDDAARGESRVRDGRRACRREVERGGRRAVPRAPASPGGRAATAGAARRAARGPRANRRLRDAAPAGASGSRTGSPAGGRAADGPRARGPPRRAARAAGAGTGRGSRHARRSACCDARGGPRGPQRRSVSRARGAGDRDTAHLRARPAPPPGAQGFRPRARRRRPHSSAGRHRRRTASSSS
jgi:hypothetical protein